MKVTAAGKQQSRVMMLLVLGMVFLGFFIFLSASLGLVGSDTSAFVRIALKQLAVLLVGLVIMIIVANIPYTAWRRYALPTLLVAIVATALVYVPGLGITSGGATRWINLAGWSFQPAELLKLGFVVYYAAWLSAGGGKTKSALKSLLPLGILLGIAAALLLKQPDTGTLLVILAAGMIQFFIGGAKWRHLVLLGLIATLLLGSLVATRPYLRDRLMTYIDPTQDTLGSSYQVNQSLIAIGSGGLTGRGFGQSLQKFNFLPQPIGDSIYAVGSEEFGFIGSISILLLFMSFAVYGLKIATQAPDTFGRLLVVGLVILITAQSFINMGAMIGLLPLTGAPLIFVSQGGSALLFGLIAAGIILNVARHRKNRPAGATAR